ncbi:hypothetical protein MRX96_059593 [Rhipicephalus microplus]
MWTQRAPTHGATNLSRHATNLQPRQPTSRKNLLCKPDGIDSAEIRQLLLTAKAREPPRIQALHFSPAGSRGAQQGSRQAARVFRKAACSAHAWVSPQAASVDAESRLAFPIDIQSRDASSAGRLLRREQFSFCFVCPV